MEWKVTLALATVQTRVLVTAPAYAVTHTTAGSKMDSSLLDVPQSITVVDHELLSDQGAYKLDDALKNVAGVMPGGYYEAWDYYRIRGFDASFNTYVDGLRGGNGMAEEIFGLESVEVLKGPSSTLYGQSVLGGIVNLRSKLPRPDAFAQLEFTGGSYGFYAPAIDAGTSLNRSRTFYARINLLYRPDDSFVNYVNRHRVYVAPTLTWDISPDTQLTLLGRYQHDTGHLGFPLPAAGASRCSRERCIAAASRGAMRQRRHLINAGRSFPIENVNQLPRVPNEIYLQLPLLIDLELGCGVEHARALALVRVIQI